MPGGSLMKRKRMISLFSLCLILGLFLSIGFTQEPTDNWSEPDGLPIGTIDHDQTDLAFLYDGDPDTWVDLDEIYNHTSFPFAFFGVQFNQIITTTGVRFRNNLEEWNHIMEVEVWTLPPNTNEGIENNWTKICTVDCAFQYDWVEITFEEPTEEISQLRIIYTKVRGHEPPVGEIQFLDVEIKETNPNNPPSDSGGGGGSGGGCFLGSTS